MDSAQDTAASDGRCGNIAFCRYVGCIVQICHLYGRMVPAHLSDYAAYADQVAAAVSVYGDLTAEDSDIVDFYKAVRIP